MSLYDLTNWLLKWGKILAIWIANFVVDLLQSGIDAFAALIVFVAGLWPSGPSLPSMPDTPSGAVWNITLVTLNWLFPVSYFVSMITFLVTAIIAYLVIAPLARWAKLMN